MLKTRCNIHLLIGENSYGAATHPRRNSMRFEIGNIYYEVNKSYTNALQFK